MLVLPVRSRPSSVTFVTLVAFVALAATLGACGSRSGVRAPDLADAPVSSDLQDVTFDVVDAPDPPDVADVIDAIDASDAPPCEVGASRACYSGPPATRNVGACREGRETCRIDASGNASWGPCEGEVLPSAERCDGSDAMCLGRPNPACVCTPGMVQRCYPGPAGTENVGTCRGGTQRCIPAVGRPGGMWDACMGHVLPGPPQCDGLDHECVGVVPACTIMVTCPGAIRTRAGSPVLLTATATASPPSTVVSTVWTVRSSPPGATVMFSAPMSTSTQFTANAAGDYEVVFTARNSAGRVASCVVMITVTETYRGTEFWAISTANSQLMAGDRFHFAIAVGNPNATAVTVNVTGGALTATDSFTVPANSTVTHILPWVTSVVQNSSRLPMCPPGCCDSNCCPGGSTTPATSVLARNGAYHILTTQPVSVYQFNALEFTVDPSCPSNSYSNDASLLLPTNALTGNYLVLAHNAWGSMGSYVTIVGADIGPVTVRVTLSADITAGVGVAAAPARSTQTYVLNPGDVVQLVSTAGTNDQRMFLPQDMTGTSITASGAVSVFAGTDCTNMSFPNGTVRACDHLEQQLFPTETWGTDVVVSQLRDRGPTERYMVRIMSREDGNRITFTPASARAPVTLDRGAFVEFEAAQDILVHSDRPILVAQFMEGMFTTPGATMGDPSMVLEVPTAQYRRDYTFVVPATYTASFVNVVGRAGSMIRLDGMLLVDSDADALAGTPWLVWRRPIVAGSHTIAAPTSAFGLKVLGVAERTSYAYPGGLDLGAM